jgi:hypothetical protein
MKADKIKSTSDAYKPPRRRGKAGGLGKAWCAPGRQEPAAHEPLIATMMLAEVPLAGLSFDRVLRTAFRNQTRQEAHVFQMGLGGRIDRIAVGGRRANAWFADRPVAIES